MPPRKKHTPSANGSLLNFFGRAGGAVSAPVSADRKGKRKADAGSAADPVIISDEDEPAPKQPRRASPNRADVVKAEAGGDYQTKTLVSECIMCGVRLPRDTIVS